MEKEDVLIFREWKLTEFGTGNSASVVIDGEHISVSLTENKYTYVQLRIISVSACENMKYRVKYGLKNENSDANVIFGWYDEKGQELVRGYVDNNEIVYSPKNSAKMEIILAIHSKTPAKCIFDNLSVTCIGAISEKKVTFATIGLNYQRTLRACEKNMEETLERIDALCSNNKTDIIVFTECMYDRWCGRNFRETSLTEHSEPVRILREKAKQYNTYMVFSIHEVENGSYYNTAFLIDRDGEITGKYRKSHLTMSEYQSGFVPGDEIPVFTTDFGTVGILICWDMFFPESLRMLQKQKVDVICHPTAGFDETRIVQRARENGVFIITAGVDDYSHSAIFDPDGKKLADASENEGYAAATVDINKLYYTYWLSYPAETISKNIYRNEARWDMYRNFYEKQK